MAKPLKSRVRVRVRFGRVRVNAVYKRTFIQVANLLKKKVILCVQRHATMFVQVYANSVIGEQIMNILKMGGPS